jgi:4'-phosphopantetheinyl transferase
VGVDVEPLAGLDDARRLAADVLTRVELSRLAGVSRLDEAVFVRGFAERWVAKEAILKATGDGLRLPMAGLELGGDRAPYRLVGWAERPDVVRRVSLHRLDEAPAGHVACLAVLGGASRPEVEELPAADLLAPRVGA